MLSVPVDCVLKTGFKVSKLRLPAEFGPQLRRVDRVAQVVAWPVLNLVVGVGWLAHHLQDQFQDVLVVLFTVSPDQVGFTDLPLGQDLPNRPRVVIGMNPVTDILPRSVELWPNAAQNVGNLPGNKLFNVLVWTVVIRTI